MLLIENSEHPNAPPQARRCSKWAAFALLPVLCGCDQQPLAFSDQRRGTPPAPAAAAAPAGSAAAVAAPKAKLAYSHNLQLEMPPASVKPRYDRAISRCMQDAALNCTVLNTSYTTSLYNTGRPNATLKVRLPHEAIVPFEADLLTPLPDEAPGVAVERSRSTSAEDLTVQLTDIERRQAQLTDYRERLTELGRRPDIKVEELIKIESELSGTQSQLETLTGQKKTLDQRVDTEVLSIDFTAAEAGEGLFAPVYEAWRQAGWVFGNSSGAALRFSIGVLPWLPLAIIGLLVIRLTFRRWRR